MFLLRLLSAIMIFIQPVSAADEITVDDAWINAPPPGVKVLAGYMTVSNNTATDIALIGADNEMFGKIEFHMTTTDSGVVSMHRQEQINIPAGKTFSFSPGGYHLMLFNPEMQLQKGNKVPIDLSFSNGKTLRILATVKRGHDVNNH